MQSTARLHYGVANLVLQEAELVFHQPIAFHPTDRVFDTNSDGRNRTIDRFLRWREFTSPRFFLGLGNRHSIERKSLEPHILIEPTPRGEGIACEIREAFIMHLAFTGIALEANMTGFIDYKEVFDRVTLLLAAGTSQRVVLALSEWGSVSHTSE